MSDKLREILNKIGISLEYDSCTGQLFMPQGIIDQAHSEIMGLLLKPEDIADIIFNGLVIEGTNWIIRIPNTVPSDIAKAIHKAQEEKLK